MKDNIKQYIDDEIGFYDECIDVEQAVEDLMYGLKIHFLKIEWDDTIEDEEEICEYIRKEWNEYN